MPDYIQLEFASVSKEKAEILIAQLSNEGFEGFEEEEHGLKAFIVRSSFNEEAVEGIAAGLETVFNKSIIPETNWNEVWESNFEPVVVHDFVAVRAHFHAPISSVKHEIIITPKMSFGTGHHATTYMMMEQMQKISFHDKTVFDFGTGTGVLAILAEQLDAARIDATDIDEWSIENAKENCIRNACTRITILQKNSALMNEVYDVILANINKNVILENFDTLKAQLRPGGILLLSGLLVSDEDDIMQKAGGYGLVLRERGEKHNWLCLKLSYQGG